VARGSASGIVRGLARLGWKLALFGAAVVLSISLAELFVRCCIPVRNVGISWTVYDAEYAQRLKKNLSAHRVSPEFDIQFTTNSMGFRGPEISTLPDSVVLFLGDSFTMGYGVTDGEEFPALVRRRLGERFGLDKVDVVNAGIGRGNGYWSRFLRSEAKRFHPTMVVMEVCGNDFEDNRVEQLFALTGSGELVAQPPPPPGWGRRLQRFAELVPWVHDLHLFGLLKQVLQANAFAGAPEAEPTRQGDRSARASDDLTYALISEAIDVAQQQGLEILVLVVDADEDRVVALRRLVREHGLDLLEVPRKSERPDLYFEVDGHWNAAGHRHVAELVSERLLANDRLARDLAEAPR
jgi:hypothetical protein